MPTLQPHIGGQSYRGTQRPADMNISGATRGLINTVVARNQRIELANRKNKIDDATIQTKKDLALRQAKFLEDPLADEQEYAEDMGSILEDNATTLENQEDQHAFSRDMSLTTTLLGIEADSARTRAIDVRGKENSYTKLKEQQSKPSLLRPGMIKETTDEGVALGFYNRKEADFLVSGANVNNAIYDAKNAESAKRVMDIVSDEDFDNTIYQLTQDERKSVYAQAKSLHDMYVVGDEFDALDKDDMYAQNVATIIGSDASQAMKSRKIFDIGVKLGMSGPIRSVAQAQLALKVGVQPSGTKENRNALFLKIERMKLEKPEDAEQSMAFLKRQRETLEEVVDSYNKGRIGHPEYVELTQKFGKDLTTAKAQAMGQVQQSDDVPWDMPFFGEDYSNASSYEKYYEDFSAKIPNTSLKAEYYDEFTRVVERMEDTDTVPPYVDKNKDKWGRRADVKKQLFARYDAGKPQRAQATLDSATRAVAKKTTRRYSDKQEAWMVYDGKGWVKE
jgi:hypothetical protein